MRLSRAEIAELIPHSGAMCLLDGVLDWDVSRIRCMSRSHRDAGNPLRVDGRLPALCGVEYAAQAMAVHGGLRGSVTGVKPKPGMLVSLRAVKFTRDYIEDLPGDLQVEAVCLQADAGSLQYSFVVRHGETLLAEGRAAVVLAQD